MKNKKMGSKLKSFLDDYGSLILLITMPISLVFCLLQYFIRTQRMVFLMIALLASGPFLIWFGLKALAYRELRNITTIGASLLGAVFLVWAGFLIIKPDSLISTKTKMIFETTKKAVSVKDIKVTLDITPTTFKIGDKGEILITVENNSKYELVLDSVMFEAANEFFDGFIVNYESAIPPISERKEKLWMSTALFFGEEQIHILPGEIIECYAGIAANIPGDYSGEYFAVLMVGLNSKAVPRKSPDVTEKLFLVVLTEE